MGLKTVSVPPEMAERFERAEEVVSRFFGDWRAAPERGTIEIFGERYVLVRAASLSVEFFELVGELFGPGRGQEAAGFARNILFDLAHAIGKSDAQNLHAKMSLEDPISRMSAGPIHFAHSGWAFVEIHPESNAAPDDRFCLLYDHPYSFESDAWIRAGCRRDFPVCIMNAGYSSGWCEASFGMDLVASELLCRARGDEHCRFLMAKPARIEEFVERYLESQGAGPGHPLRRSHEIPDFFSRKRAEEELRRSHAELEHKLEAVGRLAGGVAHDFNNLMNTILLRAHFLQRRVAGDEEAAGELDYIVGAARRAAGLTRQLLTFSRSQIAQAEPLDLSAVVSDLGRTLLPLIGEDVVLDLDLDEGGVVIEADRGQIEQVIMNLAVNARDAMPDGGALTLATSREEVGQRFITETGEIAPGPYGRLEVTDTGGGMDEATKTEGHGTGLGLSTVYAIVRDGGGGVAVKSEEGRGTSFRLYFPLSTRRVATWSDASALPAPAGEGRVVLLVEDQEELRDSLKELLEHWGYQVIAAAGPREALIAAARLADRIALLITDVVMPRMDGRMLAREIWELAPATRVLFMSGYAPGPERFDSDPRIAGFLHKPVSPDALAKALERALAGDAAG